MEGEAMEGRLRVGGKDGWDMRGNEEDGGGEREKGGWRGGKGRRERAGLTHLAREEEEGKRKSGW